MRPLDRTDRPGEVPAAQPLHERRPAKGGGLSKTEVNRHRGPRRILEGVEFATLEWVEWFNRCRLLEPIGNIPPTDGQANSVDWMCASMR